MPYVIQRKTDKQFRTRADKYDEGPRWTDILNNARVFGRKCDAALAIKADIEMRQGHCEVKWVDLTMMGA